VSALRVLGATVACAMIVLLGVEILRWRFRPEARRLRVIRKIGERR